jgi:hypothetical protein
MLCCALKASLAYAMRGQQLKAGITLFDDWDAESMLKSSGEFGEATAGGGGADALRRKSTLPSGAKPADGDGSS